MKWKEVLKPNKITILLFIIFFFLFIFLPLGTDLCGSFPSFEFESDTWRICAIDIIVPIIISYFLALFISNLTGFLKPNKISIPLFIVLIVVLLFILLPYISFICNSLFLGFDTAYNHFFKGYSIVASSDTYTKIDICRYVLAIFLIIVSYILASLISKFYNIRKK